MSRFFKFYIGLVNSKKFTIRFLARLSENDMRSNLGQTLMYLRDSCNMIDDSKLSTNTIKKTLGYFPTEPDLMWKNSLAKELIKERDDEIIVDRFSKEELECLLTSICTQ